MDAMFSGISLGLSSALLVVGALDGEVGFMSYQCTVLQRGLGEPDRVGWRSRGVVWDQRGRRARARRLAVVSLAAGSSSAVW